LKVLEEKFDFYFKEEKKNVDDVNYVWSIQHFMTIENGIFCDFASFSNKEFDHSKFFSDISSIKVKGSKLTIMNSYGRYPAHKTYEINISWGNSFVGKWSHKIKKLEKIISDRKNAKIKNKLSEKDKNRKNIINKYKK
jgi:hypothetical protein